MKWDQIAYRDVSNEGYTYFSFTSQCYVENKFKKQMDN